MGTWTQNPVSKAWTLSGSAVRSCLVFSQTWPGNRALRMRLPDVTQKVAFLIPCSKDGKSGYRVGIDASDATKVSICPVAFGTIGSPESTGSEDTPASGSAIVAHGVSSGVPVLLEARYIDGALELYVNDTLALRWGGAGEGAYGAYTHFGFESAVTGAVVSKVELATLVKTDPDAQTEVWIGVCDGNVLCSLDGLTAQVIGQGAFPPGVPVVLKPYQGNVYGIGGGVARKINPRTLSVAAWGGTTATTALPGAVEDGAGGYLAGATRMTLMENDGDRLVLAGDPQDPQNAWWCALGNADDWDTSALDRPGRAFATSADFPGRIGEPIVALKQSSDGFLIIGCTRSIWRKQGDPAIAIPQITPAAIGTGITGRDAMALAVSSVSGDPVTFVLAHTTAGLAAIPNAGPIVPISPMVLTEGVQLPSGAEAQYRVLVRRDARRHHTMIYLTRLAGGESLHFAYDERTGQFSPAAGGFMPDVLPETLGPMSACVYRGELLLGGRAGQVVHVDEDAEDDDGVTVAGRMAAQVLDEPDTSKDTIMSRLAITPALESGPMTFAVYGGRTPEEAYQGPARVLKFAGTYESVQAAGRTSVRTARAPALVLEIASPDGGGPFSVERVEVSTRPARILTRKVAQPVPDPDPLCPFPAPPSGDDSGDSGPGPGAPYIEFLFDAPYTEDMHLDGPGPEEIVRILAGDPASHDGPPSRGDYEQSGDGSVVVVPF